MKRFRRLISLSFQLALILLLTSSIMGINISPPSNSLHDRGEKHFLTLQDGIQNRTQANLPQGIHQVWWTQIQEDIRRANSPITADPLTVPAEWIKGSDQASSSFGLSIASAGDVNADGFDDILVGAPYYDEDGNKGGKVYLYHGSASGPATTPSWYVFKQSLDAEFGFSVASAGDVDANGYDDILIGAPFFDKDGDGLHEGAVTLCRVLNIMGFGYQPICNWEVTGVAPDGRLGISVSSAGDVNDDGYDDVIVGAHFSPTALDDKEGKAFIWLGSPTGLNYSTSPADADCSISGMHPKGHLGRSVSSAGDVNFDGYDDVIVGEPGRNTARGRVNIFFGNGTCVDTTAFWYYDGTWSNAWLGNAVASAGHRNNDDYADVIAGAPLYSNGETEEGAALIFYGSATGPGLSPDETLEGNQENAYYGYSVASAGDIDNDGYTEILIGAPYYNTLDLTNAGAAFLYRGSDSGIISTPFWTGFGQQDDGTFGWSVASAGDVDGQSADDILVGAPYQDDPEVDEGLVYYYTFDRLNVYLPLMVR